MPEQVILRRAEVERRTSLSKSLRVPVAARRRFPSADPAWRARRRVAGGRNRRVGCQPRAGELRP